MSDLGPWLVNVLGDPSGSFEVAVVRSGAHHERRSFGQYGPDKLLVSSETHARAATTQRIFDGLIKLAHDVAQELNEGESMTAAALQLALRRRRALPDIRHIHRKTKI